MVSWLLTVEFQSRSLMARNRVRRALLLSLQVRNELLVLEADELHQFTVEHDALVHPDGPWLRVCLRIVDRDVDLESSVIRPPEPLRQLRSVGQRIADDIEP